MKSLRVRFSNIKVNQRYVLKNALILAKVS